jgi:hypothetical protein
MTTADRTPDQHDPDESEVIAARLHEARDHLERAVAALDAGDYDRARAHLLFALSAWD